MATTPIVRKHQIVRFYIRPDGFVCVTTTGILWNPTKTTLSKDQIEGLDEVPERRAYWPQARKIWPHLAPDKCPKCHGYSGDPEVGTCPECCPKCPGCGKRFSTYYNDDFKCLDCARPTAWQRIMADDEVDK